MKKPRKQKTPGVIVRNVRFTGLEGVPVHWHTEGRAPSIFLNMLSSLFPEGERFFVRSVRPHLNKVADEELAQLARAFCAQEALHGREHDAFNQALSDGGFPVKALGNSIRSIMRRFEDSLSPTGRLAATAALEHVTAMLAHVALSDRTLISGPAQVERLWRWHAAEELEHKAVAIDVFRAVGGSEAERIAIYAVMMSSFVYQISLGQYRLMRREGIHTSVRDWVGFGRFLFARDRLPTIVPMAIDYLRPGFHPWDEDDSHLLDAWRTAEENHDEGPLFPVAA